MAKAVKKAPKDVDEYISRAPKEVQSKLEELRDAIIECRAGCRRTYQLRNALL